VDINSIRNKMNEDGWVHFKYVVDPDLVNALIEDLERAYIELRILQSKNGITHKIEGALHHLLCFKGSFLDFLEQGILNSEILDYFQGPFIINSYGGVKNLKNNVSYVGNIHRDIRNFTGDINLMLNMLVMLDDFTEENGATYLLPGSHRSSEKPSEETFYKSAVRTVGKSGDIILFNSNLWHAAGVNTTDQQRRALTLTFTKPFLKQQLDYPRALGYEAESSLSDRLQQLIGYNSRIPCTLDEWYQPADKRLYKSNQG
jgi:hypothetical protein